MSVYDDCYILLKDLNVETVSWSIPIINYSKTSQTDIPKGELLIRKGNLVYVKGKVGPAFKYEADKDLHLAPLEVEQCAFLEAIPTPKARFSVYVTDGWMDWGVAVKKGDKVYISVPMKGDIEGRCSTAIVHYIGRLGEDQPGTMFGVEIIDSRHYKLGTSDGTFQGARYFTCPDNNGLFLSLYAVARQPDWLKLQYHPKRDTPKPTEGKKKDQDIAPIPAQRAIKEQSHASLSPNVGISSTNGGTNQLPNGTRVVIMTKDGKKVKGTVRWAGQLPLENDGRNVKIPVYGIETDTYISSKEFEPAISLIGRPHFTISTGHSKVFIPQTMVELDEPTKGSNISAKSTPCTTDQLKEAGVDYKESRRAALEYEKQKAAAALAKDLRPEVAKETDIDEQVKALEHFKRPRQREDNAAADRGVPTGGPSADRQYPESSSHLQLGRESGNTQGPYHGQPTFGIPQQGDWVARLRVLGVGSAVMVHNADPLMYGVIRWIGTIPQVKGCIAGVELNIPMEGCTDGVWILNGTRYFTCGPDRGYFCLLEHLVPDQRIMPDKKSNNSVHEVKFKELQEQLAQERKLSQQYKEERDQAVKECNKVKEERDKAMKENDQVKAERDQMKKELEALKEEHSHCKAFWMVPRHHVTVMEKPLGGGAWGYVKEGKFRGQQVAVKCIHEAIVTPHTIKRVYREICTMSQAHHPNLVLFMAAVLDDQGGPLIITELLDTTLRKAYEDNLLHPGLDQCMDIFRDVASALCYLHELEEPIIHRDVSSANVLLKAMANNRWKAKLSDFGSANWAKEAVTMGEGAIVYTALEAYPVHPSLSTKPPPQTTKIDVYSYGILLCEVMMREFPYPDTLNTLKVKMKVKNLFFHSLMLECTQLEPAQRPTMANILKKLN